MVFAGLRGGAVGQKELSGVGVLADRGGVRGPVLRDAGRYDIAVFRIVDRAGEETVERQGTVILVQKAPGGDRAGNGDRMGAGLGDFIRETGGFQRLYRGGGRGAARAVQRLNGAILGGSSRSPNSGMTLAALPRP